MATIVQGVRAELVAVQGKVSEVIALVDAGVGNLNEDQIEAVATALDDLDSQVVDSIHNALALLGQPVPAPVTPVPVTTAPTVAAAKIEGEIGALNTEADAALGETKPAATETTQAEPETKPAA